MKPRISMISLGVKNLEASIRFYKEGMGLPLFESPPGVAFFDLNGTWLGLTEKEHLAKDVGIAPEGSGFSGMTLAHNVSSEEEVISVLNEAIHAGAILVKPPQKADWGGFHGYFKDLDGYLWEVAHNPFVWMGPED
ncbi:glyoxalase [Zobellia sp. OII3]|uniref:VOC family protein n=1 Tax=Zobellia sp. OII3 TaxID=2034520 RepID=UPI000B5316A4|nr:VOC family protein [Zobellia sp. OII3]OWW25925.1 glyoxalase [Zobellia sp. OII3]